jgi:GNAT superfamily N-acetyltransferase
MNSEGFRETIQAGDRHKVFELLHSSGFFLPREMAYGMGLFDEHLRRGEASAYQFMLHEREGQILAFGCYGIIPLTDRRYHLHWLAVDRAHQSGGLGRLLEKAICHKIHSLGGTRIDAELSTRGPLEKARIFYEKCGYKLAVAIPDYYADGDNKVLYVKNLPLHGNEC